MPASTTEVHESRKNRRRPPSKLAWVFAAIAAIVAPIACESSPDDRARSATISGDSVIMSEPEGDGLYIPLRSQARLGDGSLLADVGNAVDIFDPSGRFALRVGRSGSGPGEFQRISTIIHLPGDSLFAVVDGRRARILLFHALSGDLRREILITPFFPGQQWRWYGDTVVMPTKLSPKPFVSWVPASDSLWAWGETPGIYSRSISAYSQGGEPSLARRNDGWLAVFPADGRLYYLEADGALKSAYELPVHRRRGVPANLADSVDAIFASGVFRYAASLVFAIWELSNGDYAIVHADTDPDVRLESVPGSGGSANVTFLNTRYWVTFVAHDLTRACPDEPVPFQPENLLVPFFAADSVFFLDRRAASDTTAEAVLHRFRMESASCRWVAMTPAPVDRR